MRSPREWSVADDGGLDATFRPATLRFERAPAGDLAARPPVSTVVFSPSGVFYDDTAFARWLVQLLNRLGVRTEFSSFRCLLQREGLRAAYCGQMDYWTALRGLLAEIGLSRGQVAEVEAAGFARRQQCDEQVRLLPGVASAVARMAGAGLRLAVLLNSPVATEQVERRFERLGLAGYFTPILASCDTGHVLPEPAAFQWLLERINVGASSVAFVSNCPWEIAAAADAALNPIAVGITLQRQDIVAIEQVSDLVAALAGWPARPLAA